MTPQQTFRNTLIILATLVGAYILYMGIHIFIVLLVAIIIASAIQPAVKRLYKLRIPQSLSILLVYGALGGLLFLLGVLILPPAATQLGDYLNNDAGLATRITTAEDWLQQNIKTLTGTQLALPPHDQVDKSVKDVVKQITESIPSAAGNLAGLLGDFVLVVVIGVYWLTAHDQAVEFVLPLFPLGRRSVIAQVITEIEDALSNYVRGVIFVAFFVGIANFAILTLLRVPNAVTLGFIVGVTTILPLIGGYIGAGTAVLLALLVSPINAVFALGTFILVQQVETHYLTPRVMSQSVGLNPIMIIIFLFIGFTVGGVIGALIAVPIAGMFSIVLRHLVIEPTKEQSAPEVIDGGILIPNIVKPGDIVREAR